jgi:hypothetical protein
MNSCFRGIFLFDAILNVGTGAYAIVWPRSFMGQFLAGPLPVGVEAAAPLFGALCVVLGFIEWRLVMQAKREALLAFMQGFLIGDVLYIASFVRFVGVYAEWNIPSLLSVGTTASFGLCRAYYLSRPERMRAFDV